MSVLDVSENAMRYGWNQHEHHPDFIAAWTRQNGADVPAPAVWQHDDGRFALVGREPVDLDSEDWRWHVSVRYGDPGVNGRVPNWGELVETAHQLRPGVVFVIGVPPRSWWMNVHPDVLHLWETVDPHLVAEWRASSRGDRPS